MPSLWRGLVAFLLLLTPAAAHAEERILHYWSDIQVQKDSSIEVAERIDINVEHDRINHGIIAISRPLPRPQRHPFHVGFTFEGATLDGSPVKALVEPFGNGVRIKLGDRDTYVDVGEHEYVIRYRATRESAASATSTSSTNVTGNAWIFPIDEAQVRIASPPRPSSATAPSTPARKARPVQCRSRRREAGGHHLPNEPAARRL